MPGRPVVARQPMRLTDRDQPAADRAARVRGRERREVGGDRLRRRGQRLPALRPAPVREMRPVGPVGAPRRRRQRLLRVAARGATALPGRRQRRRVRTRARDGAGGTGSGELGWHAGSLPRDIVAGQGAIAAHAIMGDYRACWRSQNPPPPPKSAPEGHVDPVRRSFPGQQALGRPQRPNGATMTQTSVESRGSGSRKTSAPSRRALSKAEPSRSPPSRPWTPAWPNPGGRRQAILRTPEAYRSVQHSRPKCRHEGSDTGDRDRAGGAACSATVRTRRARQSG